MDLVVFKFLSTLNATISIMVNNNNIRFIINLAKAANQNGSTLKRMKTLIVRLSSKFGLKLTMIDTGDSFQFVFQEEDELIQESYFIKFSEIIPNLENVILLNKLAISVESEKINVEDGLAQIIEIQNTKVKNEALKDAAAFVLIGAAAAVLFASPLLDIFFGGMFGLLAFGIVVLASKVSVIASNLELSVSIISAILANILAVLLPGTNPFVLVISATAVFIPGYLTTLSINEILQRFTLTGINRLINAMAVFIKLFIGATIGTQLVLQLWKSPIPARSAEIPFITLLFFGAVLFYGAALIFRVKGKNLLWVTFVGTMTFASLKFGTQLGYWQGALIGGFVLSLLSSIYAKITDNPATVVSFPGVMALVPGVLVYVGIFSSNLQDGEQIVSVVVQLTVTIIAIFTGISAGFILSPPKDTF